MFNEVAFLGKALFWDILTGIATLPKNWNSSDENSILRISYLLQIGHNFDINISQKIDLTILRVLHVFFSCLVKVMLG